MKFPITLPWVVLLLINVAIIVILGFVSRQLFDVKSFIQLQDQVKLSQNIAAAIDEPEATISAEPSPTPKAKKMVKKMVEVEVEE